LKSSNSTDLKMTGVNPKVSKLMDGHVSDVAIVCY